MYTKVVPITDFKGKPHNIEVQFNLEEREVFKLLVEFQSIMSWRDSIKGETRELSTEEVIVFYNNLEEILLSAWGEVSDDGLYFHKRGRYDFEESKVFSAVMKMFLEDPVEANKLIDGLMPKGLQDMVEKADANLAELAKKEGTDNELAKQIELLRAENAALTASKQQ